MLDTLITSRTRVKLLLKFFSNASNSAYLRGLADEFGESTNSIRVELNRLTEAGLLESQPSGNTIRYRANTLNPLFPELQAIVIKYFGFDSIVENVIKQLGKVEVALISGSYAEGSDSGIIDLMLVGEVDKKRLYDYIEKTESMIKRKLRPLILNTVEFGQMKNEILNKAYILLWGQIVN